jgi:TonB family protein
MTPRLLGLVLLAAAPAALAQNVLVVEEGKTDQVVRAINLNEPMVVVDGKFRNASGTRFALRKAAAYRTGFIKIADFFIRITHSEDMGDSFSYGIDIFGHLESNTPLKRCFIVLEITSGKDRGLIYNELPDLPAGESRELRIVARLQEKLDDGRFALHVFSDGLELLNSKMSPRYVLQESRKTEELMLKKAPDRPVALDGGKARVAPIYPAALVPRGLAGSARIRCTINSKGEVIATEVVDATHELFGEAAAAAVRQWKFEPAIVDHRYAEATAIVPVDFTPPAAGPAK